jgi:hypothetical protein
VFVVVTRSVSGGDAACLRAERGGETHYVGEAAYGESFSRVNQSFYIIDVFP